MTKPKEYRALVGIDYKNADGEEVRVEASDKIDGMPEDEVSKQLNQGNIEVWKDGRTKNVRRPGDAKVEVHGVFSRHAQGDTQIVLTDAREKAQERGDVE